MATRGLSNTNLSNRGDGPGRLVLVAPLFSERMFTYSIGRGNLGSGRPGLLSAERRAAGAVRRAARRRPRHHPAGSGRRRALHPGRRQQGLEPHATGAAPSSRGIRAHAGRLPQPSTAPGPRPTVPPGGGARLRALGRCIPGGEAIDLAASEDMARPECQPWEGDARPACLTGTGRWPRRRRLRTARRRRAPPAGDALSPSAGSCQPPTRTPSGSAGPEGPLTWRLTSRCVKPCRNSLIAGYSALSLALTSQSRSGPGVSCVHLRRLRRDPVPYRRSAVGRRSAARQPPRTSRGPRLRCGCRGCSGGETRTRR
jgi:hypothetical protein